MDEPHFAPWNDDSPANANKQWCPMFNVQDSVHPFLRDAQKQTRRHFSDAFPVVSTRCRIPSIHSDCSFGFPSPRSKTKHGVERIFRFEATLWSVSLLRVPSSFFFFLVFFKTTGTSMCFSLLLWCRKARKQDLPWLAQGARLTNRRWQPR